MYTVLEGNSVNLKCEASNDPDSPLELQFEWTYNFTQHMSKNDFVVLPAINKIGASILKFDNVSRSQAGVYTCRVYNHQNCSVYLNFTMILECKLMKFYIPILGMYLSTEIIIVIIMLHNRIC